MREDAQHDEEEHAFERRLVELARMARGDRGPPFGEDHAPGHVGRPPPELAVDEVGEPAEEEPERHRRGGDVEERQHRDLRGASAKIAMATIVPSRPPWNDMPPSQTRKNAERIVEEMAGLVEERVAEAAAERRCRPTSQSRKSSMSAT